MALSTGRDPLFSRKRTVIIAQNPIEEKMLKGANDAFDQIWSNNFAGAEFITKKTITDIQSMDPNNSLNNLLRFLDFACEILMQKILVLKKGWSGEQANQFRFKVLGTIEKNMIPEQVETIDGRLCNLIFGTLPMPDQRGSSLMTTATHLSDCNVSAHQVWCYYAQALKELIQANEPKKQDTPVLNPRNA